MYHRDLQLNAVRLTASGDVLLTDFGYSGAKLSGSGGSADVRDRSASPAFTPPEVLLGHSIVNASYDGESLGEQQPHPRVVPHIQRRQLCCARPSAAGPQHLNASHTGQLGHHLTRHRKLQR